MDEYLSSIYGNGNIDTLSSAEAYFALDHVTSHSQQAEDEPNAALNEDSFVLPGLGDMQENTTHSQNLGKIQDLMATKNLYSLHEDFPTDDDFIHNLGSFMTTKGYLLYKEMSSKTAHNVNPLSRYRQCDQDEKAGLPAIESFMKVPEYCREEHFYKTIEAGAVVVGCISAVSDPGLSLWLFCTDSGRALAIQDLHIKAFCKTRDIPTNEGTKKSVDIGRCPDNPKYSQNNQDQRNSAYSTDIDRFKDGQLPENPDYSNNERSVKGLEHGGDRERPSSPWEDELPLAEENILQKPGHFEIVLAEENVQQKPYQPGDYVRGVIVGFTGDVMISLRNEDLPEELSGKVQLGILREDLLPEYYRKTRKIDCRQSYTEVLSQTPDYNNPRLEGLCGVLDVMEDSSLMADLQSSLYKKDDYADRLREKQLQRLAQRSVVEGIQFTKQGRHEKALECLDQALELDPNNLNGLVARGALLASTEKYTDAISNFEQALSIQENYTKARIYMCETLLVYATSLMEIERDHDAVPLLKRALSLDPTNNEAESLLNQIQYKPPLITLNVPEYSPKTSRVMEQQDQIDTTSKSKKAKKSKKMESLSMEHTSPDGSPAMAVQDEALSKGEKKKKKKNKRKRGSRSPSPRSPRSPDRKIDKRSRSPMQMKDDVSRSPAAEENKKDKESEQKPSLKGPVDSSNEKVDRSENSDGIKTGIQEASKMDEKAVEDIVKSPRSSHKKPKKKSHKHSKKSKAKGDTVRDSSDSDKNTDEIKAESSSQVVGNLEKKEIKTESEVDQKTDIMVQEVDFEARSKNTEMDLDKKKMDVKFEKENKLIDGEHKDSDNPKKDDDDDINKASGEKKSHWLHKEKTSHSDGTEKDEKTGDRNQRSRYESGGRKDDGLTTAERAQYNKDSLEQEEYKKMLYFVGIPETADKISLEKRIKDIISQRLKMQVNDNEITGCCRDGLYRQSSKSFDVYVTFKNMTLRNKIYRFKKNFGNIYVNEALSPNRTAIYSTALKMKFTKRIFNVTTWAGKVFIALINKAGLTEVKSVAHLHRTVEDYEKRMQERRKLKGHYSRNRSPRSKVVSSERLSKERRRRSNSLNRDRHRSRSRSREHISARSRSHSPPAEHEGSPVVKFNWRSLDEKKEIHDGSTSDQFQYYSEIQVKSKWDSPTSEKNRSPSPVDIFPSGRTEKKEPAIVPPASKFDMSTFNLSTFNRKAQEATVVKFQPLSRSWDDFNSVKSSQLRSKSSDKKLESDFRKDKSRDRSRSPVKKSQKSSKRLHKEGDDYSQDERNDSLKSREKSPRRLDNDREDDNNKSSKNRSKSPVLSDNLADSKRKDSSKSRSGTRYEKELDKDKEKNHKHKDKYKRQELLKSEITDLNDVEKKDASRNRAQTNFESEENTKDSGSLKSRDKSSPQRKEVNAKSLSELDNSVDDKGRDQRKTGEKQFERDVVDEKKRKKSSKRDHDSKQVKGKDNTKELANKASSGYRSRSGSSRSRSKSPHKYENQSKRSRSSHEDNQHVSKKRYSETRSKSPYDSDTHASASKNKKSKKSKSDRDDDYKSKGSKSCSNKDDHYIKSSKQKSKSFLQMDDNIKHRDSLFRNAESPVESSYHDVITVKRKTSTKGELKPGTPEEIRYSVRSMDSSKAKSHFEKEKIVDVEKGDLYKQTVSSFMKPKQSDSSEDEPTLTSKHEKTEDKNSKHHASIGRMTEDTITTKSKNWEVYSDDENIAIPKKTKRKQKKDKRQKISMHNLSEIEESKTAKSKHKKISNYDRLKIDDSEKSVADKSRIKDHKTYGRESAVGSYQDSHYVESASEFQNYNVNRESRTLKSSTYSGEKQAYKTQKKLTRSPESSNSSLDYWEKVAPNMSEQMQFEMTEEGDLEESDIELESAALNDRIRKHLEMCRRLGSESDGSDGSMGDVHRENKLKDNLYEKQVPSKDSTVNLTGKKQMESRSLDYTQSRANASPDYSKQRVSKSPDYMKLRESKSPDYRRQRVSKSPDYSRQRVSKSPDYRKQRVSKSPDYIKLRESKSPDYRKQRESKSPGYRKQRVSKSPDHRKQRVSKSPEYRKQRVSKSPDYMKLRESKSPDYRKQRVSKSPDYRKQRVSKSPEYRKQRVSRLPDNRKQRAPKSPDYIKQRESRSPDDRKKRDCMSPDYTKKREGKSQDDRKKKTSMSPDYTKKIVSKSQDDRSQKVSKSPDYLNMLKERVSQSLDDRKKRDCMSPDYTKKKASKSPDFTQNIVSQAPDDRTKRASMSPDDRNKISSKAPDYKKKSTSKSLDDRKKRASKSPNYRMQRTSKSHDYRKNKSPEGRLIYSKGSMNLSQELYNIGNCLSPDEISHHAELNLVQEKLKGVLVFILGPKEDIFDTSQKGSHEDPASVSQIMSMIKDILRSRNIEITEGDIEGYHSLSGFPGAVRCKRLKVMFKNLGLRDKIYALRQIVAPNNELLLIKEGLCSERQQLNSYLEKLQVTGRIFNCYSVDGKLFATLDQGGKPFEVASVKHIKICLEKRMTPAIRSSGPPRRYSRPPPNKVVQRPKKRYTQTRKRDFSRSPVRRSRRRHSPTPEYERPSPEYRRQRFSRSPSVQYNRYPRTPDTNYRYPRSRSPDSYRYPRSRSPDSYRFPMTRSPDTHEYPWSPGSYRYPMSRSPDGHYSGYPGYQDNWPAPNVESSVIDEDKLAEIQRQFLEDNRKAMENRKGKISESTEKNEPEPELEMSEKDDSVQEAPIVHEANPVVLASSEESEKEKPTAVYTEHPDMEEYAEQKCDFEKTLLFTGVPELSTRSMIHVTPREQVMTIISKDLGIVIQDSDVTSCQRLDTDQDARDIFIVFKTEKLRDWIHISYLKLRNTLHPSYLINKPLSPYSLMLLRRVLGCVGSGVLAAGYGDADKVYAVVQEGGTPQRVSSPADLKQILAFVEIFSGSAKKKQAGEGVSGAT